MNISKIFCTVLLSSILAYSTAQHFINGRPKGGFLGSPGDDDLKFGSIKPETLVSTNWYTQKLDHFDSTDTRTFSQKYYKSNTYYKNGGPLFILIGGEGAISASWMNGGAWIKYAQRYNAYCVQLEHRFYGDTQPLTDASTDNLKYLTIKQALADLAAFIRYFNDGQTFSQVIVFGGSYSGALAAWLRLKYPFDVDGAVASSAPVNIAFNFKGYLESVDYALRYYYPSGDCNDAIKQATAAIKENLKTLSGRQYLKSIFKLCYDIDPKNTKDVSLMIGVLANRFKTVTQYNNINTDISDLSVADVCDIMTNPDFGEPIERYGEVNRQLLKADCINHIYNSSINYKKKTSWASDTVFYGSRQWNYQTCTEFGSFQSTESPNQPFGNDLPIGYWTQECADIFGTQFNAANIEARVERFAAEFDGLTTDASRVIFVNGNIDPWHKLGVLKDGGPYNTVIYINGTSHCADMYTQSDLDIPELTEARNKISDTLGIWLQYKKPNTERPPTQTQPNTKGPLTQTEPYTEGPPILTEYETEGPPTQTRYKTEGPSTQHPPLTTTSHSSPVCLISPYILGLFTIIALAYNSRN